MTCDILKIKTTSMTVAGTQLNITIPNVTLTNGQVFRLCLAQEIPVDTYVKLACDILTDVDAPKNATKKNYIAKHY